MKQTPILLLSLLLSVFAVPAQTQQQRDRRADLNIRGYTNLCVSATGQLWMSTSTGMAYTADDIHSTWRMVIGDTSADYYISGRSFECMAAWGNQTAVAAGFLQGRPRQDFVFRTTDGGKHWDTVVIDPNLDCVHACSFFPDGRVWLGSASGTSDGVLAYSADSGRTFKVLRTKFKGETGIHTLHMVNSDSGYVGNYTNSIFSTSDNWRTIHRVITPMEQLHLVKYDDDKLWIEKIRQWKKELIVRQIVRGRLSETFHTPLNGNIQWQPSPITLYDYEVDPVTDALWAVSDSGQLVRLTDWEHIQHYGIQVGRIVGVVDGKVYCEGDYCVLRVSPDGKTDTCGFYTTEYPIEQDEWYWDTLPHGSRLWGCDGKSVYLKDSIGWYRVAQISGGSIRPHPESADRVIVFGGGRHYSVDTAGHVEPYLYQQPLGDFVKAGLREVEIVTFASGCFHYSGDTVRYDSRDGVLHESYNNVEKDNSLHRTLSVNEFENALQKLGERYNIFPTPQDFGLQDTTVDIHAVYDEDVQFWSTSQLGYNLKFVNYAGDTLRIYSSVSDGSNFDGSIRFPWLLPMHVTSDKVYFVTYQPCLWQVLKELMPDSMLLHDQLDNITLHPLNELKNGDLLFLKGGNDKMDKAIRESTGNYTHVAIVERDSADCLWIIEASTVYVRRILYDNWKWHGGGFDAYRLNVPFDAAAVIARAKSFVGQHYDNAFLPDNGELYCSELVYEAYLDSNGNHLFESKPMNFRDQSGRMPKYWKKHFRRLGIPVPEGVPGTNPTDLSKSPLLERVR